MSVSALQKSLLSWYQKNKRNLPWRRTRDPYAIWISEIMLQQTQVATVIPYYEKFLKRFPDIRALAHAKEEEVLRFWAGLGYYSRARNLHKAAKQIVEESGSFPSDFEKILSLPGIGRYTAGAIASIAFNQSYPVLDGNVARVFSRLFRFKENVKAPAAQKRLWSMADQYLERKNPGDWNQALMELGATVCAPGIPDCARCPVSPFCEARKAGAQESLPLTGDKKKPVSLNWEAALIRRNGSLLLSQRPKETLLKNTWGLPTPAEAKARKKKLLRTVQHSVTHHKITMKVYEAEPPGAQPMHFKWVPIRQLSRYLISSLWKKALPALFLFPAALYAENPGIYLNVFDSQTLYPKVLPLPILKAAAKPQEETQVLSLGDLAETLSKDPEAVQHFLKMFSQIMTLDEKQQKAVRSAFEKVDKKALDRFPVLTAPQLLTAAQAYARLKKPEPKEADPENYTVALTGSPRDPGNGAFMKDLGHSIHYGDQELTGLASSYGDSLEISKVLNWLSLNDPAKPSFTLMYGSAKFHSVNSFVRHLLDSKHTIEILDTRYFANFGDLWYEKNGRKIPVVTPLYVDTGLVNRGGKPVIIPVSHSQIEISIRGAVNADIIFFLGVDGGAKFRPKATKGQSWVGGRAVASYRGAEASAMMEKASSVMRELNLKAKNGSLPLGGYGPLGSCNDGHAFVTGTFPYPMVRDPRHFKGSGELDKISQTMPSDLEGTPDLKRILNSLPYDDPSRIPIPWVRETLSEIK